MGDFYLLKEGVTHDILLHRRFFRNKSGEIACEHFYDMLLTIGYHREFTIL